MKFRPPARLKGKSKKRRGFRYLCGCEWCIENKNYSSNRHMQEAEQQVRDYFDLRYEEYDILEELRTTDTK